METVLEYLSLKIKLEVHKYMQSNINDIEEIRIRAKRSLVLKTSKENIILQYIVSTQDILETFEKICENSVYSYKKQICEGFITIKGGHRVGITGNCVIENEQVININYISSLNFRIAREKISCSQKVLPYVINLKNNDIYNTLIISKPGCGKTTILRDLIRNISNGVSEYNLMPKTCGVVDERGEIAAMYKGVPQNDVGILTDVIGNVSKSQGMKMLIRALAPDIIACDEIGSKEDIEAINYAMCSGVKGIFTAHGNDLNEIFLNKEIAELINKNIIETIIFLDSEQRGKVKEVYILDIKNKKYIKQF